MSRASFGIISVLQSALTPRYVRKVLSRWGDSSATVRPLEPVVATRSSSESPAGASSSRIQRPSWSSPTQPIRRTPIPASASASAEFAPAPPTRTLTRSVKSVPPAGGRSVTGLVNTSAWTHPITVTDASGCSPRWPDWARDAHGLLADRRSCGRAELRCSNRVRARLRVSSLRRENIPFARILP